MKKVLAILTVLLVFALCSTAVAAPATEGVGTSYTTRTNGSGVTSFNTTFAFVQFDENGAIENIYVDVLETSDPKASSASCPRFAVVGTTVDWYNPETKEMTKVEVTDALTQEMAAAWATKRERGTNYGMGGAGEWFEQMDAFQNFFKGKTIEELKAWTAEGLDANGKAIDAIAGATMSVTDGHSDIMAAIFKAWDNRVAYVPASQEGVGFSYVARVSSNTGVTSYNTAFARVKLDENGKIADVYVDVLETQDPSSSTASCPKYVLVGNVMKVYNAEKKESIDVEITAEMAQALVESWATKRERGTSYGMGGAGEWFEQMDAFQNFFKGKTIEELKTWAANGLDEAGKPIDAIAGATMSVTDSHSDIMKAIFNAAENIVF